MFIIFGWGRRTMKTLGWIPPQMCPNCHNERPWVVMRIRRWFTVFFIPVLPYESGYVAMCPICSRGFDVDRSTAFGLVQGQRRVPTGEGPTEITGPKQGVVAGGVGYPRRRGHRNLIIAAVLVAIIAVFVIIGSLQNGNGGGSGGTAANAVSGGVPTVPPVANAYKPTDTDLARLSTLVENLIRLNNSHTTLPADGKARAALAARFSSMATKIGAWRTSFAEASPSTLRLCGCAVVNARAIATELRDPSQNAFSRLEKSRVAFNKVWDRWTPDVALSGQ